MESGLLTRQEFDRYRPGDDPYAGLPPDLRLDDLGRAYRGKPLVSYVVSTWNRRHQLARSLECLARQTFRKFEVLLVDDSSPQDISGLAETFRPHLKLRYFLLPREEAWHSCPSRAFRFAIPKARGEVVAVSHPEVMLHQDAMEALYRGAMGERLEDARYYVIDRPDITEGEWYWVSLKPFFLDGYLYERLDEVDWHSDFNNVTRLKDFMKHTGFAGLSNVEHLMRAEYPWWFAAAARRDCPVWRDMPQIDGHGIIDMWLMRYRAHHYIVDVVPDRALCLHQPHQTTAVAPEGEQDRVDLAMPVGGER